MSSKHRKRPKGPALEPAVYLALGVLRNGTREILGLWIEQTEGAKFLDEGL